MPGSATQWGRTGRQRAGRAPILLLFGAGTGRTSRGRSLRPHQSVFVQLLVEGHAADAELGGGAEAVLVVALQRHGNDGSLSLVFELGQGRAGRRQPPFGGWGTQVRGGDVDGLGGKEIGRRPGWRRDR